LIPFLLGNWLLQYKFKIFIYCIITSIWLAMNQFGAVLTRAPGGVAETNPEDQIGVKQSKQEKPASQPASQPVQPLTRSSTNNAMAAPAAPLSLLRLAVVLVTAFLLVAPARSFSGTTMKLKSSSSPSSSTKKIKTQKCAYLDVADSSEAWK
jgi:hypothetical protein